MLEKNRIHQIANSYSHSFSQPDWYRSSECNGETPSAFQPKPLSLIWANRGSAVYFLGLTIAVDDRQSRCKGMIHIAIAIENRTRGLNPLFMPDFEMS
jgi:hypothetical protein